MASIEVKVPDIGDFDEVSVIELLVKPGDTVKPEQSLVTVESDKASMEIPSSSAGVVKELKVKLGDKVKEGSVLLVLESSSAAAVPSGRRPPPQPHPQAPAARAGLRKPGRALRAPAAPAGRRPARSKSASPTSATSRTSPSSSCWSSPAMRSSRSSRCSRSNRTRRRWRFRRRPPAP